MKIQPLTNRAIQDLFIQKANDLGMKKSQPEPILTNDPTLLFTNSTIVCFKDIILESNIPKSGLFVIQDCLRCQNIKSIRNPAMKLEYMSCFKQAGILVDSNSLHKAINFVQDFIFNFCHVSPDKLRIKSSKTVDFNNHLINSIFSESIVYDSECLDYYSWTYGIQGVSGSGVTFSLKNDKKNSFEDFGNLIALMKNDTVIGYEFGFGIETLLSRFNNNDTPFDSVPIINNWKKTTSYAVSNKVLDTLMVSSTLLSLGILPIGGARGSILRRNLNDLCYLIITKNLNINEAALVAMDYATQQGLDGSGVYNKIMSYFQSCLDKINLSEKYIEHGLRHGYSNRRIYKKIRDNYGIPDVYCSLMFNKMTETNYA